MEARQFTKEPIFLICLLKGTYIDTYYMCTNLGVVLIGATIGTTFGYHTIEQTV